MKKICLCAFFILTMLSLFASPKIGAIKGISTLPCVWLMESGEFDVEVFDDSAQSFKALQKGKIDITFVPSHIAAQGYNLTDKKLVALGAFQGANLYLVSRDGKLKKLSDLLSKKVNIGQKGSPADVIFRNILSQNNIPMDSKGGVSLDYSVASENLALEILDGSVSYAVLSEPYVSLVMQKKPIYFRSIDLQKEADAIEGRGTFFPSWVILTRKNYVLENYEDVERFLSEYKKAVTKTKKNPGHTARLQKDFGFGLSESLAFAASTDTNFYVYEANEAKFALESYLKLFDDAEIAVYSAE